MIFPLIVCSFGIVLDPLKSSLKELGVSGLLVGISASINIGTDFILRKLSHS